MNNLLFQIKIRSFETILSQFLLPILEFHVRTQSDAIYKKWLPRRPLLGII